MPSSWLLLSDTILQRNIRGRVNIDVLRSNHVICAAYLDHRPTLHEFLRNSSETRAKIVFTQSELEIHEGLGKTVRNTTYKKRSPSNTPNANHFFWSLWCAKTTTVSQPRKPDQAHPFDIPHLIAFACVL